MRWLAVQEAVVNGCWCSETLRKSLCSSGYECCPNRATLITRSPYFSVVGCWALLMRGAQRRAELQDHRLHWWREHTQNLRCYTATDRQISHTESVFLVVVVIANKTQHSDTWCFAVVRRRRWEQRQPKAKHRGRRGTSRHRLSPLAHLQSPTLRTAQPRDARFADDVRWTLCGQNKIGWRGSKL